MTPSNSRLVTVSTLAFALSLSWAIPSVAMAAPPALPADQPAAAPAPAPAPAPEAIAVQPQPAPQPMPPQPAPQPWPQPQPQAQPQYVPAPVYVQPGPPPPAPTPIQARPNPNRGLGMAISGFSVFAISYLITAGTGTVAIDAGDPEIGRPLLIPIVGPFIAAARLDSATLGFGLGFVGVIQLATLGMGIGGSVMLAKARRQSRVSATAGGLQLRF